MIYRLELNRGYGFQVRGEGEVPADTGLDTIKADAMRSALNGPVRAFLDGALVFEHGKLTRKQAKAVFGL
jgi:hypothetical protein